MIAGETMALLMINYLLDLESRDTKWVFDLRTIVDSQVLRGCLFRTIIHSL